MCHDPEGRRDDSRRGQLRGGWGEGDVKKQRGSWEGRLHLCLTPAVFPLTSLQCRPVGLNHFVQWCQQLKIQFDWLVWYFIWPPSLTDSDVKDVVTPLAHVRLLEQEAPSVTKKTQYCIWRVHVPTSAAAVFCVSALMLLAGSWCLCGTPHSAGPGRGSAQRPAAEVGEQPGHRGPNYRPRPGTTLWKLCATDRGHRTRTTGRVWTLLFCFSTQTVYEQALELMMVLGLVCTCQKTVQTSIRVQRAVCTRLLSKSRTKRHPVYDDVKHRKSHTSTEYYWFFIRGNVEFWRLTKSSLQK